MWQSPYCGDLWFVEGIEVTSSKRKQGIGKVLLTKSIELLRNLNVAEINANIYKDNIASIALHRSLGFEMTTLNKCLWCNKNGTFSEEIVVSPIILFIRPFATPETIKVLGIRNSIKIIRSVALVFFVLLIAWFVFL